MRKCWILIHLCWNFDLHSWKSFWADFFSILLSKCIDYWAVARVTQPLREGWELQYVILLFCNEQKPWGYFFEHDLRIFKTNFFKFQITKSAVIVGDKWRLKFDILTDCARFWLRNCACGCFTTLARIRQCSKLIHGRLPLQIRFVVINSNLH